MSQKKAKEQRRQEREAAANPTPIGTISIEVYQDLDVRVTNFPSDHGIAMMVLANAMMKVSAFFIEEAQKNKSNLVIARPGASRADIIKMAAGN